MLGSIDIRRHPITMVSTFMVACLAIILVAALAFMIWPSMIASKGVADFLAILTLLIASAGCVLWVYIIDRIYWSNYMVLGSDRLIYYMRYSLRDRRSHQIELSDINDIVAIQHGSLANFMNYGTLVISFNDGHPDYQFTSCNDPNFYAQEILRVKQLHMAAQPVPVEFVDQTLNVERLPIGLSFLSGREDDQEIEGM
jgi:hypothetical protein